MYEYFPKILKICTFLSTVDIVETPPFFAASETDAGLNIFPSETPTFVPRGLLVAATGIVIAQEHIIAETHNIDNIFFIIILLVN